MANRNRPLQCANCFYPLDHPTVMVNGISYCCAGCAQGGPCICSYGHPSPGEQGTPENPGTAPPLSPGYHNISPSEGFTEMVENMVREVEITRQVVNEEEGPVKDLLALLQKATRLLQVMAYRLDGQQGVPPSSRGGSRTAPTRFLPEPANQDTCERITLVVENATEPDIAFSYTRALGKLESVRDIKLASINNTNLLYHVDATSKAKFAREVMSLPDYRPVRVQATLDEITVLLNQPPADANRLDRLLASAIGEDEDPGQRYVGPGATVEARPPRRPARKGVMEAGIDGFFNARHYLVHNGEPGPVQMKSWRVELSLEGDQFDENGMLSGFDRAQEAVEQLMAGYNNQLLNKLHPYDQIQPTPENIARTLYEQLKAAIADQPLRLKGLKVWASPTQYVWYSEPPDHAT